MGFESQLLCRRTLILRRPAEALRTEYEVKGGVAALRVLCVLEGGG
jgi:hypothetical protein